jgi:hypothetical protein
MSSDDYSDPEFEEGGSASPPPPTHGGDEPQASVGGDAGGGAGSTEDALIAQLKRLVAMKHTNLKVPCVRAPDAAPARALPFSVHMLVCMFGSVWAVCACARARARTRPLAMAMAMAMASARGRLG